MRSATTAQVFFAGDVREFQILKSACQWTCSREADFRKCAQLVWMEVRTLSVVTRGLISPGTEEFVGSTQQAGFPPFAVSEGRESLMPMANCRRCFLPLRLASGHLFDLWLLRSPWIIAGLQRLVGLTFLARRAFCFLAFFSAEFLSISHEFSRQ